jgi:hypothetical protein
MTPVTLLLDEVIGKAHETFEMPDPASYEVVRQRIDKVETLTYTNGRWAKSLRG